MKNRYKKRHISLFFIIAVLSLAIGIHYNKNIQITAISAQIDPKGEIIVIFKDKLSDKKLDVFLETYGTDIELINHLEDYVLLSVKENAKYLKILHTLQRIH